MSLRDNLRTKEEIFYSDYITVAEMSLFESTQKMLEEQLEYREKVIKTEPVLSRFELMDL